MEGAGAQGQGVGGRGAWVSGGTRVFSLCVQQEALHNRIFPDSAPHGSVVQPSLAPGGVFPWWAGCLHVCSRSRPCLGAAGGGRGQQRFCFHSLGVRSWVWSGLLVQEAVAPEELYCYPKWTEAVFSSQPLGETRGQGWPSPAPARMVSGTGGAPWLTYIRLPAPRPARRSCGSLQPCGEKAGPEWPSEWPSAAHGGHELLLPPLPLPLPAFCLRPLGELYRRRQ